MSVYSLIDRYMPVHSRTCALSYGHLAITDKNRSQWCPLSTVARYVRLSIWRACLNTCLRAGLVLKYHSHIYIGRQLLRVHAYERNVKEKYQTYLC